jgi:hypothetical protein
MLGREFRGRPDLGMACGRQELVRDLLDDGSYRGADGREPTFVANPTRRTERMRAWESRRGRLFSVHGQLLAWRGGWDYRRRGGRRRGPHVPGARQGLRIELRRARLPRGQAAAERGAGRVAAAPRAGWLAALSDHSRPGAPAFAAAAGGLPARAPRHLAAVHLLVTLLLLGASAVTGALAWGAPGVSLPGALAGFGIGAAAGAAGGLAARARARALVSGAGAGARGGRTDAAGDAARLSSVSRSRAAARAPAGRPACA